MSPRTPFAIRPARAEDAPAITEIAIEVLSWSRIYDLGPSFANILHRHIAASEHGLLSVGVRDEEVMGFLIGAFDAKLLFRQFLLRHGLRAGLALAPQLLSPRRAATVFRGLTYFPEAPADDPGAEILSFAIRPEAQRSGLGTALFRDLVDRYAERGTNRLKVGTIDVENEASNRFFAGLGATILRSETLYSGKLVNVYQCDIPTMREVLEARVATRRSGELGAAVS